MTATILSIQGETVDAGLPEIPAFEGNPVASTRAKVTGSTSLDVGDEVFRMDDVVRMVVEARVDSINHVVDKDGKLCRVHAMKVVDSIVIEWAADLSALRDGLK